MKKFKSICAALVLLFCLSLPAFADDTNPGDVHVPGRPCPVYTGSPGTQNSEVVNGSAVSADITGLQLADLLLTLASFV
jgi:hypothetical protein